LLPDALSSRVMKSNESQFYIEINGRQIPAKLIREARRSIRASVGKAAVTVRMPLKLSVQEQQAYLSKFKTWLEKKLAQQPAMLARFEGKDYQDGDTLVIGKRKYVLEINYSDKHSSSGRLKNGVIALKISQTTDQKTLGNLISRLVAKDYSLEITQRVQRLNDLHFKKPIHSITLKNLHSRWGSCSSKGNINLSTRLLFAPEAVRDYVIIHELAHLTEMNHSPRFWKLVATAMPDYKLQEKWLKEHGEQCRF